MKTQIALVLSGTLVLGGLTGCKKSAPNVLGMDLNAATAKLQESGLKVGSVAREYAGVDKPPGCILRQDPAPGASLSSGAAVNLVQEYSLIMPNIVGQDIEAAKQLLESRGFGAVRVDKVYQSGKPLGTVLTQDPPAELRVDATTLAGIAIQSYVLVPNLVGMPLETALNAITQQGLVLGDVTQKKSQGQPGTVTSQTQKLGAKVALGTSIDLVVASEQNAGGLGGKILDLLERQADRQIDRQLDKALGTSSPSPQAKNHVPPKNAAPPRATSSVPARVSPPVVAGGVRTQVISSNVTRQIIRLNPTDPIKAGSIQPAK